MDFREKFWVIEVNSVFILASYYYYYYYNYLEALKIYIIDPKDFHRKLR